MAGSAILLTQNFSAVTIDIETNGSDITVESSTLPFSKAPSSMEKEIAQYLSDEIKSPNSTMATITSGVTVLVKNTIILKLQLILSPSLEKTSFLCPQ